MRKIIGAGIAALALLPASHAGAVGVLIGSATLDAPGDLTQIKVASQIQEFLDVPVTQGLSLNSALAAYGTRGFHWASGAEVADLFGAFGITYASPPLGSSVVGLPSTLAGRTSFQSYLGITASNATLGWINDLTTSTYHTYACISGNLCGGSGSFVRSTNLFWPADPNVGFYFVRAVPEASSLAMLSLGLAAVIAKSRKRSNLAASS